MGSFEPVTINELSSAIVREIKSGRSSVLKKLTTENCLINAQERETGNTSLHIAILYQQWSICSLLLKQPSVDLNSRNKRQQTPLLAAVDSRYWKVVERLLQQKPVPSQKAVDWTVTDDLGQNAVHLMCARGAKPKLLRALLTSGKAGRSERRITLLSAPTSQGDLAIHCAIKNGHDTLVAEFASFDPEALSRSTGDGTSCLRLAVLSGSGAVVATVLSCAVQPLLLPADFIWDVATAQMTELLAGVFDLFDYFPESALPQQELSPSDGAATTASMSPYKRKATNVRLPAKWRQLSFGRQSSQRNSHYKLLKCSIDRNVAAQLVWIARSELNHMRPSETNSGSTNAGSTTCLLFWAIENKDASLLSLILAQPETDIKVKRPGSETLLHLALSCKTFSVSICDIVLRALKSRKLICEGKAGLPKRKAGYFHSEKRSNKNATAHTSIWSVYRQVLINARTELEGATPLHCVMRLVESTALSEKKGLTIIKDLLDMGADPNAPDNLTGATPLHLCVRDVGSPAITTFLVQRGADPHVTDKAGHSAYYFAAEREQSLLAAALGSQPAAD